MKRIVRWIGMDLVLAGLALAAVAVAPRTLVADEPAASAYEVVLLSLDSDWQAMRFHSQSGEAWYALAGNWKPVPEPDDAKPPAGDYRIYLAKTGESDWIALRIERKSGRSWRLAKLKWAEMKVLDADKP